MSNESEHKSERQWTKVAIDLAFRFGTWEVWVSPPGERHRPVELRSKSFILGMGPTRGAAIEAALEVLTKLGGRLIELDLLALYPSEESSITPLEGGPDSPVSPSSGSSSEEK